MLSKNELRMDPPVTVLSKKNHQMHLKMNTAVHIFVALTKPVLFLPKDQQTWRRMLKMRSSCVFVSAEGGLVRACQCNLVCRARLGWCFTRWTQNTDVELRGGWVELDSDITSRKEIVGSMLRGFMFTQLSSGHIDFFWWLHQAIRELKIQATQKSPSGYDVLVCKLLWDRLKQNRILWCCRGFHTTLPLSPSKCCLLGKLEKCLSVKALQDQSLWTALSVIICVRSNDPKFSLGSVLSGRFPSRCFSLFAKTNAELFVLSDWYPECLKFQDENKFPPMLDSAYTQQVVPSLGTTILANRKLKPIWLDNKEPRT